MQHEKATNGGGGDRHAKASQNQEERREGEQKDKKRSWMEKERERCTRRDLTRRRSLTRSPSPLPKFQVNTSSAISTRSNNTLLSPRTLLSTISECDDAFNLLCKQEVAAILTLWTCGDKDTLAYLAPKCSLLVYSFSGQCSLQIASEHQRSNTNVTSVFIRI